MSNGSSRKMLTHLGHISCTVLAVPTGCGARYTERRDTKEVLLQTAAQGKGGGKSEIFLASTPRLKRRTPRPGHAVASLLDTRVCLVLLQFIWLVLYIYTTTTIRSRWYRVAASGAMFLRGLLQFFSHLLSRRRREGRYSARFQTDIASILM